MAKTITSQNFEEEVLKSEKPILLDFWATWCGPCMRQGPIVEELGEEGYAVGKLDVDQNMELAQQFRVMSIPTLIIFKNGAEAHRLVGLTDKEELKKLHTEIDLVTTPVGDLVAMVHCNNCTSDINTWVNLFKEFAEAMGMEVDMTELFKVLFQVALKGEPDCGGLLAYNYFSGESITGFDEGRPLFVRHANDNVSLANFMRVHLFTALGALKNGLDILLKEEKVPVDKIYGHGGFFTVPVAGQKIMAAAMDTPVTVMDTASEGGAWGIAVLAQYLAVNKDNESLADYLSNKVFVGQSGTTLEPDAEDVKGFDDFLVRYNKGLAVERAAVENL